MISIDEQDVSLGALEQYEREVKRIPSLEDEEEAHLLQCLKRGENVKQVRDRLVAGYQSLVFALARRFKRHCRVMDVLDFVQEGNKGLLWAIERYDGMKDSASFRTWVFERVRGMMLTALWRYEQAVRIPWRKLRAIHKLKAVGDELSIALGREPAIAEIAVEVGMAERDVRELLVLHELQVISLGTSVDEEGEVTLAETIEDSAASAFLPDEDFSSIEEVLKCLTQEEQAVVLARYGSDNDQPCTQRKVAEQLKMPLNRVQELDRRARLRLRRVLERPANGAELMAS